jgi:hypothetical protein
LVVCADIETFVEKGLSIITLRNIVDNDTQEEFDYIPSTNESTIALNMINPKILSATYILTTDDDGTLLESWSFDDSEALSNKLYIILDPTLDAEQKTINFTLDIYAPSIDRTYDSTEISITCDTPPNEIVALEVGSTENTDLESTLDDFIAVVAFTLPSEATDDDLESMQITYNITGDDNEQTTMLLDVDDYTSFEDETDLSISVTTYTRYFSPPGAISGDEYDFYILLIDAIGQKSSTIFASSSIGALSLSYVANEGIWINEPYSGLISSETEVTLPVSDDISNSSFTLLGWSGSDGTDYEAGETITINSDISFTAIWGNTVTYYSQGTLMSQEFYVENDVIDISTTIQGTTSGYTFAGWDNDESSDTTVYYDVDDGYGTDNMSFTMETSNLDLYAVWVEGIPIRTEEELEAIAVDNSNFPLSGNYYLTRDIELTGTHTSIGDTTDTFSGSFDGCEHTLSDLTMNLNGSGKGLFSSISGSVQDLTITNANLTASTNSDYSGILSGYIDGGTIENCSVSGDISSASYTSSSIGGIAGFVRYYGSITNCTYEGDITTNGSSVGGIVGKAATDTTITGCTVNLSTLNSKGYTGGIIGQSFGAYINDCDVNDLDITMEYDHAGGLIGFASFATISDCTSEDINMDITGSNAGGLVGYASSATISGSSSTSIEIVSTESYLGGLIGYDSSSTISDCTSTTIQIDSVSGYYLGGLIGHGSSDTISNCTSTGIDINSESGYHLGGLIGYVSYATISSCISDTIAIDDGSMFSADGLNIGGLIGYVEYSDITNCSSNNLFIIAEEYAGAFIGSCYSSNNIAKSYVKSGLIDCIGISGGFIGYIDTSADINIDSCYSEAYFISGGSDVGGFIGKGAGVLNINNSYFYGSLATATWGMIADDASSSTLINCYVIAEYGSGYLGFISTALTLSDCSDCYYLSDSEITDSYGTNLTDSQFLDSSNFLNWDGDIWGWDGAYNDGYPYLKDLILTY